MGTKLWIVVAMPFHGSVSISCWSFQNILLTEGRKTTEVEVHGQSDDATTNGQLKSSSSKRTTLKECSSSNSERRSPKRDPSYGLPFAVVKFNDPKTIAALETNAANQRRLEAKRRFRYCYECGRSLGICSSYFIPNLYSCLIIQRLYKYQIPKLV